MAVKKKEAASAEQIPEEQESTALPEVPENTVIVSDLMEEPKPVCYLVNWPGGVHLRDGPGKAYRSAAVLENGSLVMGEDISALLRKDRKPRDAAWLNVLSTQGPGWVDSAYLKRVDDPAE